MSIDKTYIITLEGIGDGIYTYKYDLGEAFFRSIEYTDFTAIVDINVELIKQAQLMELHFRIKGEVHTECDCCLREITLPIQGEYMLIIKYGGNTDNGEVVYIPEESREINIRHYLYEFTGLSIPMTHTCADTALKQCPEKVRNILDQRKENKESQGKLKVWDALEGLTFDKED